MCICCCCSSLLLLQALASLLQEQAGKHMTDTSIMTPPPHIPCPLLLSILLLLQALASLLQEQAGKDVMVSAGGVPLLVHGLEHPDADVTAHCSEMLARLAGSSAAQTAIRCVLCPVPVCWVSAVPASVGINLWCAW
jgi:hypothetical protein